MIADYVTLKSLHVLGAVVFVGNIVVTALWKSLADRTRQPAVIAFAQRLVTLTDWVFTAPGAALVAVSGLLMARSYGDGWWTVPWLAWGLGLFALSGMIWAVVLIPVQVRQARLARSFAAGGEVPAEYWKLARLWTAAGVVATVLPLLNLYFMVFKPV